MADAASFRCVSDVAPSAIEVECPNERFATRVDHETRSLQHRSHAVWHVNKGPKLLARQPQPEVFQHNQGPHMPTVLGIGEPEQLARPPRRLPKQRFSVRVAADDALVIELRLRSAIPSVANHAAPRPNRTFPRVLCSSGHRCYLAGITDSAVRVSPFTVPFTVTFCAAYLSSSASWPS